jgi:hypothetical protein
MVDHLGAHLVARAFIKGESAVGDVPEDARSDPAIKTACF